MTYKLFIDDERFPVDDSWIIVRSSAEAIQVVKDLGMPSFISFDHDLGGDDISINFITWLANYLCYSTDDFPKDFDYYVHSQNPVGKQNIEGWMQSIIKHFKN